MHSELAEYIDRATQEIHAISADRKRLLEEIAGFVTSRRQAGKAAELFFICTHNSRRSHMGQLWAAAAAARSF